MSSLVLCCRSCAGVVEASLGRSLLLFRPKVLTMLAFGAFMCFTVIGSSFTRSLMVSVPIVLKILGVWLISVCRCKASLGRSLLLSIPSVLKTPGT